VLVRCGKLFVIIVIVLTTCLHWTALQTVAWASMLANNLKTHSVSEAFCETFDGQHPCCLCKAIAAAKNSEKKSDAILSSFKLEFPPVKDEITLISPDPISALRLSKISADSWFPEPLVPPPRATSV